MPNARIDVFPDPEQSNLLETVDLGQTVLEDGKTGYGEAKRLYAVNTGDTILVNVNIGLSGPGARLIQLARDENGAHGIWAQPGEGIVALAGPEIRPTENFVFWARGVFSEEDEEQKQEFSFIFESTSRMA
jgi:hypothetical protein